MAEEARKSPADSAALATELRDLAAKYGDASDAMVSRYAESLREAAEAIERGEPPRKAFQAMVSASMSRLLTVKDVEFFTGRSKSSAYRLANAIGERHGGKVLVPQDRLEAFLKQRVEFGTRNGAAHPLASNQNPGKGDRNV